MTRAVPGPSCGRGNSQHRRAGRSWCTQRGTGMALARPWHGPGTAEPLAGHPELSCLRHVPSCRDLGGIIRGWAPGSALDWILSNLELAALQTLGVGVSREKGTGVKRQRGDNADSDTPNSPQAPGCILGFKWARKDKNADFRQPGWSCIRGRFRVFLGWTKAVPAPVPAPLPRPKC